MPDEIKLALWQGRHEDHLHRLEQLERRLMTTPPQDRTRLLEAIQHQRVQADICEKAISALGGQCS